MNVSGGPVLFCTLLTFIVSTKTVPPNIFNRRTKVMLVWNDLRVGK